MAVCKIQGYGCKNRYSEKQVVVELDLRNVIYVITCDLGDQQCLCECLDFPSGQQDFYISMLICFSLFQVKLLQKATYEGRRLVLAFSLGGS